MTLNNLAGVAAAEGRVAEAEGLYRRTLAMKEKLLGAEHPDTALTQHNLADFLAVEGRAEEARALSSAAVRTFETLLPADHPKVVAARGLLQRLFRNIDLRSERPLS